MSTPRYVGLAVAPTGQASVRLGHASNDLVVEDRNLKLVHDAEAVGQHARQRLGLFKGEWFLDPDEGVDWYGEVLGFAESRLQIAEAVVKRVILDTPGVTALEAIATRFDRQNRGAIVERCTVATVYDEDAEV